MNGEQLPAIFKDALESDVFSQILEVLATEFVKANEPVYQYLNGLSNVKRFSALILFASDEDKESTNIFHFFLFVKFIIFITGDKLISLIFFQILN